MLRRGEYEAGYTTKVTLTFFRTFGVWTKIPGQYSSKAMQEQARVLLQTMAEAMQAYYDERFEQWQESDKGNAMQERIHAAKPHNRPRRPALMQTGWQCRSHSDQPVGAGVSDCRASSLRSRSD